jgi:hypothetical protein
MSRRKYVKHSDKSQNTGAKRQKSESIPTVRPVRWQSSLVTRDMRVNISRRGKDLSYSLEIFAVNPTTFQLLHFELV